MAVSFTLVTVRGRRVDVVVHRTGAQMRRAARAWNGDDHPADVLGVTHGFSAENNPQAVVRLSEEHLTRRVIDHELVHAAQAIYGHDFGQFITAHPLDHWTHYNETFAYTFTELQHLMYAALAGNGLTVTDGF
ncbi:hypothetical protein ACXET9_07225 [Brachybacterium sp. DNPG3]